MFEHIVDSKIDSFVQSLSGLELLDGFIDFNSVRERSLERLLAGEDMERVLGCIELQVLEIVKPIF